uniref:Protein takeout n=2 Tax=Photinus pyralis TaxID=7054 RepID=A0A1Y1LW18_PHOPY
MLYLSILCALPTISYALQLPPNFLKCKRSDPKINDCLKPAVGRAIHIMAEGMPDFKIEPIQPIRVPSLKIEGSVTQSYEDFQIFNVPSAKITHLDSSITDDEFNLNLTVFLKDIHIAARYKLQGQILLLPIVGEGNCTTDLRNAKVSLALSGVPTEKTGRKNVEIRSLKVNLDPEKVEFDFENLFNGDTQLGPQMNRIMNENSREIFNDVRHGYEEALGAVFKNIANLIFKRIPYDELVPL